MDLASLGRLVGRPNWPNPSLSCPSARPHSAKSRCDFTWVRTRRLFNQRREWDSNPRGPETNALAGRRLKPLGHPSKAEQQAGYTRRSKLPR